MKAQLHVKGLLCSVYPKQVTKTGIQAPAGYQFIHADKGPHTYYVLRDTEQGLYFLSNTLSLDVGPLKQARAFSSYEEAKNVFDTIFKRRPLFKPTVRRKWCIERRQGFVAKGANPRMTALLGGERPWYQSDFVLRPT